MDLTRYIAALEAAGFEPDARHILDALWLASRGLSVDEAPAHAEDAGRPPSRPNEPVLENSENTPTRGTGAAALSAQPVRVDAKVEVRAAVDSASTPVETTASAELYARGAVPEGAQTVKGSAVGIHVRRRLPDRLAVMQAFRPLRQRWPSQQFHDVDEEGTVETTARLRAVMPGSVYPVFTARKEPWFDVDVVLEDDAAVELWTEALEEFCQILRDTAAFRFVTLWRLRLAAGRDGARRPMLERVTREHDPRGHIPLGHLRGYGVRRLVMFATHGSSSHWHDGSYARILRPLAQEDSVLLLHLMPPGKWARTRLSEPHGLCSATEVGGANASLHPMPFWWASPQAHGTRRLLAMPVAPLKAKALSQWARALMARGQHVPMYLLDPMQAGGAEDAPSPLESRDDFARAVNQLRATSQTAFQLAFYLCQSAFIIPIARLVLEAMCDSADHDTDLAELLQSGLVETVDAPVPDTKFSAQYFQIRPLAREILVRSLREADRQKIADALQGHIKAALEKRFGQFSKSIVAAHDAGGQVNLPADLLPIAIAMNQYRAAPQMRPAAPVPAVTIKESQTISAPAERPARAKRKPLDRAAAKSRGVVERLRENYGVEILGAIARLVLAPHGLDAVFLPPPVWAALTGEKLIHEEESGDWRFDGAAADELRKVFEETPLLGVNVLWVDDHPQNNEEEEEFVQNWGATILRAKDTRAAIAHLERGTTHVVITDMVRGKNSDAALDLMRRMRDRKWTIPVIVYTSRAVKERARQTSWAGAFGCTDTQDDLYELLKTAIIADPVRPSRSKSERREILLEALVTVGVSRKEADDLTHDYIKNGYGIGARVLRGGALDRKLANFLHLASAFADAVLAQVVIRSKKDDFVVVADDFAPGAAPGYKIVNRHGLIARCIKGCEIVWEPNVHDASDYVSAEPQTRAELVLPLITPRGESFGAVNIEMAKLDALTDAKIEWLEAFTKSLERLMPDLRRASEVHITEKRKRILFSYHRHYRSYADALAQVLRADVEVEWDWVIGPGDKMSFDAVTRQIKRADAVLVVAGSKTAESVFSRSEIDFALKAGKPLIPVLVNRHDIGMLQEVQPANFDHDTRQLRPLAEVAPKDLPLVILMTARNILRILNLDTSGLSTEERHTYPDKEDRLFSPGDVVEAEGRPLRGKDFRELVLQLDHNDLLMGVYRNADEDLVATHLYSRERLNEMRKSRASLIGYFALERDIRENVRIERGLPISRSLEDHALIVALDMEPVPRRAGRSAGQFLEWVGAANGGGVKRENANFIVSSPKKGPSAILEEARQHMHALLVRAPDDVRERLGRRLYLYFSGSVFRTIDAAGRSDTILVDPSHRPLKSGSMRRGISVGAWIDVLSASGLFEEILMFVDGHSADNPNLDVFRKFPPISRSKREPTDTFLMYGYFPRSHVATRLDGRTFTDHLLAGLIGAAHDVGGAVTRQSLRDFLFGQYRLASERPVAQLSGPQDLVIVSAEAAAAYQTRSSVVSREVAKPKRRVKAKRKIAKKKKKK